MDINHIIIAVISTVIGYVVHYLETRNLLKQYRKAISDASLKMEKLTKQIKK